jgi:hypothetical protein
MISMLRALKSINDQHLRIIELLDRGYVSPQAIPTKDMSEVIEHIQRNLLQQMTLIYRTEKGGFISGLLWANCISNTWKQLHPRSTADSNGNTE